MDGTSAFNTRTVGRDISSFLIQQGKERLMEIQQHDGVVVEVAGSRQGFAKHKREGEVLQGEREAPGAVGVAALPPPPTIYRDPWGAPALGDQISKGPAPPRTPINSGGGEGGQPHPKALAPPSPSRDTSPSSRSAWRSPAGIPLLPPPRRRAAGSPSTSPSPLLDQEGGDVSPNRTCVERGGAVRSALGSSVIWITTSTTPSTPFS